MSGSHDKPESEAKIAQLAQAIWESEGRPEGRHLEHWQRASEMVERGEDASHLPRPVQPGFEDAAPGMVPDMKQEADGDELLEGPGGRFAKQIAEATEERGPGSPRNLETQRPANPEGQVGDDDQAPPVAGPDARSRARRE